MDCHQCQKHCHSVKNKPSWWKRLTKKPPSRQMLARDGNIALVGTPNVGKSVLFNRLTGVYVNVSNYPGTTVEVSRGITKIKDRQIGVIDTPGMYSLVPISEEEKVARDLLLQESLDVVIHVVDGKNIGRMLPLTFQLIEAGLPVVLAVNMMDEAENLGLKIESNALTMELGIPVVLMSAALNRGIRELKQAILQSLSSQSKPALANLEVGK
ncbi:MAG: FeoB small GTPase domain-containing protein [Xenococcaceae cyanobacterium MO_234.B1]|nr:FeoB small GTPase domain-containing protein [Xenococcaceae cyanobacterium MO_234.B1]